MSWSHLIDENRELKAENQRLREALEGVVAKQNCVCKFLPFLGEDGPCETCKLIEILAQKGPAQ